MKRIILISLIALCYPVLVTAQQDTAYRMFKTRIILNYPQAKDNGILYAVKDSAVVLAGYASRIDLLAGNIYTKTIDYKNIAVIKTRNKNSVLYRTLAGLAIGTAVGALIGYSQGDDPQCEYFCLFQMTARDKAGIGAVLGGVTGASIGALCGLITINIPINGNLQKFRENRGRLKKYAFAH
jgi:hypothetical protein